MTMQRHLDTIRALDKLKAEIDNAKKVPPFRKLAAAECALQTAVAVLQLLSARIATLEKDFGK